ncbi:MAG: transcription termination factor Rho [Planctomycetes bacterium]|nr:transcription termination factor Rho [Planctomycetota bacterium]
MQALKQPDLVKMARSMGAIDSLGATRQDVIYRIVKEHTKANGLTICQGVLDAMPDGSGFVRSAAYSYTPSPDDVYIPSGVLRRSGTKQGDTIVGQIRPPRETEKYFALLKIDSINFEMPEKALKRKAFEDLTPLHPHKRLFLEHDPLDFSSRIVNLFTPIGKGQRGLIVAPPRVGKTILMAKIAHAIEANHPEVMVIVLLIDERPEEVTNMKRSIRGEVVASTFDEPPQRHAQVTDMVLQKAMRLVEYGKDVVLLVDSITRMGRAFNNLAGPNGKIMSGGMDVEALQKPKVFFGMARAIENGGSLTVLATCLIDTGSKMDEVIFEEFKGTGNMELILDRSAGNRRIFPALDLNKSGTRKEELIMDKEELKRVLWLRKLIADIRDPGEIIEMLVKKMTKYRTNAELLMNVKGD